MAKLLNILIEITYTYSYDKLRHRYYSYTSVIEGSDIRSYICIKKHMHL